MKTEHDMVSIGMRALAAAAVASAVLLGLACPYFLSHGRVRAAAVAGLAAAAAGLFAGRIKRTNPGLTLGALAIGVIIGFVAAGSVFPYRGTAAKWALTPETTPAQVIFMGLYLLGAVVGGVIVSYLSSRTPRKAQGGSARFGGDA